VASVEELLSREHIPITLKPGASKTAVLGVRNDALHIAIHAPPEDGKANSELLRFLRELTGHRFEIVSGGGARRKLVRRIV
jgi:hypothetical protein